MTNFFDTVVTILKQDERFFTADGELLRNAVYESAMKMDSNLLKLLYQNETTRNRFFTDVDGISVFDKVGFGWVINNRSFLPDSYTRYKNKIGLVNTNDDYISNSNDVALAFPFKDCVLEADSTRDVEERAEVFFNEKLASSEIDTLLYPKTFTNANKFCDGSIQRIKEFDNDNILIKGNNLLALYSLLPKYAGKVKLIYWDILYNTKNDKVPYNDNFKHSSWLVMMKNRLEIAKKLLRNDGLIFIQCDKNEDAYLTVLMDELFCNDTERSNHICTITVKSNSISGVKTAHKNKTILKNKDSILVYKKGEVEICPQYSVRNKWDTHYNSILVKNENGKLEKVSLKEHLIKNNIIESNEKIDENSVKNTKFKEFVLDNADLICQTVGSIRSDKKKESLENVDCVISWEEEGEIYYAYNGRRISFLSKTIKEINGEQCFVQLLGDLWTDIDFQNTQNEGGVDLPAGKKPEALIKRIIDLCTNENDIVLDAYLGSGTTAAVCLKTNRKFIGIEQLEKHFEMAVARCKNVISGEQSGISKYVNWQGGGSFVYCELAKLNQNFVERIESTTDNSKLAGIWNDMLSTGFISCKVNPSDVDFESKDFTDLSLDEKKRFLMEMLDKNQLYVNYCDMEDETFAVSEEDKAFTNSFYGEM